MKATKMHLLILDYDGVVSVTKDSVIRELSKNFIIAIASRNHFYRVSNELKSRAIKGCISIIMADFRPKNIQIKHIESLVSKVDQVIFVDDHEPNLRNLHGLKDILTIHYGTAIESLGELLE